MKILEWRKDKEAMEMFSRFCLQTKFEERLIKNIDVITYGMNMTGNKYPSVE